MYIYIYVYTYIYLSQKADVRRSAVAMYGYLAHKKQRPPRTLQQDCA